MLLSIQQESTKEDNSDNGQDDEELELAFASNNNLLKSWRGPVFTIFVIVLLICLVGSYASLWNNRMSEWPALPGTQPSTFLTFSKARFLSKFLLVVVTIEICLL